MRRKYIWIYLIYDFFLIMNVIPSALLLNSKMTPWPFYFEAVFFGILSKFHILNFIFYLYKLIIDVFRRYFSLVNKLMTLKILI